MIIKEFDKNKIVNRLEAVLNARYDKSGIAKIILKKLTELENIKKVKFILSEETGTVVFIGDKSASIIDVENRDAAWWLRRWVFFDDEEENSG